MRTSRRLVVTTDPVGWVLDQLPAILDRVPDLQGFRVGHTIDPDVTPDRHIGVSLLGETEYHTTGLIEADIRLQIWAPGDQFRQSAARQLMAHMRASMRAQVVTGPVDLPDPVDQSIMLTQIVVSVLTKGTQQS